MAVTRMLPRRVSEESADGLPSVHVAKLVGVDEEGVRVELAFGGEPAVCAARTMTPLSARDEGREVVVAFEGGEPSRPIVLGLLRAPDAAPALEARADGERVVIAADREIELRCGEASIVLTKEGKVLIRGEYVLTHSRGKNRIRGASVSIN